MSKECDFCYMTHESVTEEMDCEREATELAKMECDAELGFEQWLESDEQYAWECAEDARRALEWSDW